MLCKTIILSNSENLTSNAPKGILTLSKENDYVTGKIRLYNTPCLPSSTKVGIYVSENVYISPIINKQQFYTFSIKNNIDITQNIYCALIDTSNNKKVLLEGGSLTGFCFTDSPLDSVMECKDEELEQTIDEALQNIDDCESCNCANCEYKKYFYENYQTKSTPIDNTHSNLEQSNQKNNCNELFNRQLDYSIDEVFDNTIQSNIVDKIENEIVNNFKDYYNQFDNNLKTDKNIFIKDTNTIQQANHTDTLSTNNKNSSTKEDKQHVEFLDEIVEQLNELLQKNPADDVLNSIIPNSKFVKIESESTYVVGVIYENQMLKYIAYGVPANYNELPPKDLGENYQWLPLNPRDVMSDGYFMIFQDALNGNIVEINFEE